MAVTPENSLIETFDVAENATLQEPRFAALAF
jgi:hypothetical protein